MGKVIFTDKTLLITGGGSGIGEALAYQFAQRGTNIILVGRNENSLKRVQENCLRLGVKAWYKTADMENPESIDSLVEYILKEGFRIDFFVLNAGVSQRAKTLETDISIDRKLMEVNYFGGVYLIKSLKNMLLSAEKVHIAVTSSISGLFGFSGVSPHKSDFVDPRPHQDRNFQKCDFGIWREIRRDGSRTSQRNGCHQMCKSGN